ncbi:MAG: hypothetical protein NTW21_32360 [Verrucomicrobia bacterium]|nr:hypothetical protein [Verrucomicrobiota bacterium]
MNMPKHPRVVLKRLVSALAIAVAVGCGGGSAASAAMITIDVNSPDGISASTPLSGPAGNTAHWTNAVMADNWSTVTASNLVTDAGTASTVGISLRFPGRDPWGTPALQMLESGVFNPGYDDWGQSEINGLSAGGRYDLYIAGSRVNDDTGANGTFHINGQHQTLNNGPPPRNGSTWVEHVNYVKFSGLVADGAGKITFQVSDGPLFISGLQLVSAVPVTVPLAPSGLGATVGDAQVTLSWAAATGATGYNVKRSTTSGAGYALIGTSSVPTYTDPGVINGTPYYYVVSATNSAGESANSAEVGATPSVPPATAAKDMLSFGPGAIISGTTIAWTVPYGTALPGLAPAFTVSALATGTPVSGTSRDFTSPQTYTVTARDGSTKVYTVTVTVAPSELGVTFASTFLNVSASGTGTEILNTGTLIEANHVGAGGQAPLTLTNGLAFGISTASLLNPDGGNQEVLPVESRSTGWLHNASDNRGYTITDAAFNNLMNHAWWIAFTDSRSDLVIGGLVLGNTYRLQLISEAPNAGTVSVEGSPEYPWSGTNSVLSAIWTATDTTLNMQYSRKQQASAGGQGDEVFFQGYALHDITQPGSLKNITSFTFPGLGTATLAGTNIFMSVPYGTVVTNLAPTYTVSANASGAPASGTVRDFSAPQTYTITAQNGTTKVYTVILQPAVTLGLAGSPLPEAGGVATVTATLSAAHTKVVTVNLTFAGTATLSDDYTPSANSIVIPAGSTSGSITLTAVQDALYESPDETIVVGLGTVVNATASASQQVTATIADDDPEPLFPLTAGQRGMVPCRDNPAVSYDVYLPSNYSTELAPLPILYTFSPWDGGLVSDFQAVCANLQIITIGIRASGAWDPILRNIHAVTRDVRQRLRFDPTAEMAAGFSGGGVAAYEFCRFRAQHAAGVYAMGGWLGRSGTYYAVDRVQPQLLVARSTGTTDTNARYYVPADRNYLYSCGALVTDWDFVGGHEIPPDATKTAALTWILTHRVQDEPDDSTLAQMQATEWRTRIGAGGGANVLREAVSVLMHQPRSWYAYQAQLILDQLLDDPGFRTLDVTGLASGDFARDLFYYAVRGAGLNSDWQHYHAAMKALTGVSGVSGHRSSAIYSLLEQYGYLTPVLRISHASGQLQLALGKETLGLTYALEASPNLGSGTWQELAAPVVETNTAWSAGFAVPTGAPSGFYRIRTTPSPTAVP